MNIVVCDTSTLIKLNKAGALDLLGKLFNRVYLPVGVQEECLDESIKQAIKAPFFEVRKVKNILLLGMGKGEREAISLAIELKAETLLTDDEKAGQKTLKLGLSALDTTQILILAKDTNLIDSVKFLLDKMRAAGEGIEDDIYFETLRLANEI